MSDFRDIFAPYSEGDCPVCDSPLKTRPGGRPKRYCSEKCRKAGQRRREGIRAGQCVTHPKFGIGYVISARAGCTLVKFRDQSGDVFRDLLAHEVSPYKGPAAPKKRTHQFSAAPEAAVATLDGQTSVKAPWFKRGRSLQRNYYPSSQKRLVELMEKSYGKKK